MHNMLTNIDRNIILSTNIAYKTLNMHNMITNIDINKILSTNIAYKSLVPISEKN